VGKGGTDVLLALGKVDAFFDSILQSFFEGLPTQL
jgi:hypothetical protein